MKNRTIQLLMIGFFLTTMMSECVYEDIPQEPVVVPDSVFFNQDIIPIFEANCNSAGCHNQGGIPPDLSPENAWTNLVFFQYVDTTDASGSSLVTKISPGGSMAVYASDQDVSLIIKWIEQGAQNN